MSTLFSKIGCWCCHASDVHYEIVLEVIKRNVYIATNKRLLFPVLKYQCLCEECFADGIMNEVVSIPNEWVDVYFEDYLSDIHDYILRNK